MSFIESFLASVFANLLFIITKRNISGQYPKIHGRWIATYSEPTEAGITEAITEIIEIRQFYKWIRGVGIATVGPNRTFHYKGDILINSFEGNYQRGEVSQLGGKGVFQLKITSDNKFMRGYCMWFDRDTDRVECSVYEWKKDLQ